MNSKKVNIIVLNYNNYQDTIECITSILQLNYTNYNLIVIDNVSTNNSFDHLKNHFKFLKENSPSCNYQLLDENAVPTIYLILFNDKRIKFSDFRFLSTNNRNVISVNVVMF